MALEEEEEEEGPEEMAQAAQETVFTRCALHLHNGSRPMKGISMRAL